MWDVDSDWVIGIYTIKYVHVRWMEKGQDRWQEYRKNFRSDCEIWRSANNYMNLQTLMQEKDARIRPLIKEPRNTLKEIKGRKINQTTKWGIKKDQIFIKALKSYNIFSYWQVCKPLPVSGNTYNHWSLYIHNVHRLKTLGGRIDCIRPISCRNH